MWKLQPWKASCVFEEPNMKPWEFALQSLSDCLGWHWPYATIKHAAEAVGSGSGFIKWAVTAGLDGVLGLILGFVLIPIVTRLVVPMTGWLFPEKA